MSKKKYSNDMEMKIVEEYLNGVSTRSLKEPDVWQIRTSLQHNLEILKLLVYNKPFGMSRKYNKLHSEPSETIMEYLVC